MPASLMMHCDCSHGSNGRSNRSSSTPHLKTHLAFSKPRCGDPGFTVPGEPYCSSGAIRRERNLSCLLWASTLTKRLCLSMMPLMRSTSHVVSGSAPIRFGATQCNRQLHILPQGLFRHLMTSLCRFAAYKGYEMTEHSTILVTGGSGYIGAQLVPKLLAAGCGVRVLDAQFFPNGLDRLLENRRLEVVRGDIRDKPIVEDSLRGIDTVIHLAAVANDPSFNLDPEVSRSINIDCLPHLARSAKRSGCQRFIYASSASVYGINAEPVVDETQPCMPVTDYSRYKAEGEKIVFDLTDSSFETVAVRAATVCGWSPRQRFDLTVNMLTASALARGQITVFGGDQFRPSVHIGDLCRLYTVLAQRDSLDTLSGRAINVGYTNHTVSEIATQVKDVVDSYFNVNVPISTTATDDVRSYRLDSRLMREELGFNFVYAIRDAILEICDRWQSGWFNDSADVLTDPRYHNLLNIRVGDWSYALRSGPSC
ncbi:NAD(P)-dependent oxidoreductase [Trinickia symbiotica]|uniref:NAD(P)-dependent oxidoreductase n=2 Tax=Trinickia symbiotica TaxID=863227 RepID=A0A2N7XAE4_9BURK|nr:NAD(P)-dependent oxidoreductase [Trinickia symbiotica]